MAEYIKQEWKDAIVDEQGHIIEAGTVIDKAHMNRIEDGISEVNIGLSEVTDRGYVASNLIGDVKNITKNGKYRCTVDCLNIPIADHFTIDANMFNGGFIHLIAKGNNTGKIFSGLLRNDVDTLDWKEIPTMDKVLPLTGGTLSGEISVPTIKVLRNDLVNEGGEFTMEKSDGKLIHVDVFASTLRFMDEGLSKGAVVDFNQCDSNMSNIYHTGNITVSQAAPTTTLPNGCMHNVY